ncbi:ATP-dependent DNA helicase RecG [Peptoniphilus sp. KCTC 25270]|uniref:ATP-dependent DNA helicase RecG n=1 Tax=Peptoniphilus sp. KCTC 25270 TaxID=2897414 RepID=UPI001E563743|nr:ATP-dependent DNA helicase RecG [Peptoniphilus sp. KCTC 25270]MCD1147102.1 ATP-dependent DNA helicase RecG [Peptoniphilus sp. KCTC 25270]
MDASRPSIFLGAAMKLSDNISKVKGVGPKISEKLHRLKIHTVEDLLFHFPHRYEDETRVETFKSAPMDEKRSFIATVIEVRPPVRKKGNLWMSKLLVEDESAEAELTFFNQPYISKQYKVGNRVRLYGKVNYFRGRLSMSSPKIEFYHSSLDAGKIEPIYPAVEGLRQQKIAALVDQALKDIELIEFMPKYLQERYGLMNRKDAIVKMHHPRTMEEVIEARNRLVFEEFFVFQLALWNIRKERKSKAPIFNDKGLIGKILENLSFELTNGQKQVWTEIEKDFQSGKAMGRLIQGDVGSGKTILSLLALARAVENGYQGVLMAPTEILARQHMESVIEVLEPLGVRGELLTGSTTEKRKREILENVKNGMVDVLVGTHALIEDNVEIPQLGITITDEQHRFGVNQRKKLQEKNEISHHLVMSATPIPRTLSQTIYGDMDVSTVEGLPPGRQPIDTLAINKEGLEQSFHFMEEQLKKGHQAYVVCALIDENDKLELDSAVSVYERLSERFSSWNVELLHGRMDNGAKDEIMGRFKRNESQILVSTTVIEVGVNVPNANVLFVYNADRFGLATLHQLRGRVGRGSVKSYCILYSESENEMAWKRLGVIQSSNDGFYIAQKDLELRGGGDVFGTRQSGMANFRVGNPLLDQNIMRYALLEAKAVVEGNHLNEKELPLLYEQYKKTLRNQEGSE